MQQKTIQTFHRLRAAATVLAGVLVFGAAGVLALNPRGGAIYVGVMAGLIVVAALSDRMAPDAHQRDTGPDHGHA